MKLTIKQLKLLIKEQIEEGPWSHLDPDELKRFTGSYKSKEVSLESLLDELLDATLDAIRDNGEGPYIIDSTPEAKKMRALQAKIIAKFGK